MAIMAPTAAMALDGTAIAALIGRAPPLAFVFALAGVMCVSYAFVRLTREVNDAGSVYAFTAFTPRARCSRMEGISVALIVILVVVIFAKLLGGSAPAGHTHALGDTVSLPSGVSVSTVATAAVFGFLSFAGLEGAASLGEETDEPARNIPRALFLAPLAVGCSPSS